MSRLPTGPYILPGLDEFEVTFVDHTKPSLIDIGDCKLAQLLNYIGVGDKGNVGYPTHYQPGKWPAYKFDRTNHVFIIHSPKPNFKFNQIEGNPPWVVEFDG